ncbi:MAG: NAD(P)/FAD-dependent oxidoreductase [Alphaproteobacteria bacterium]|nr:NAD(P)/FAD-dependent oxidoreductase [Alphaproteobacteria bacterium]
MVVGAGAAGLMCAMVAGERGHRVLLLDHAAEPGKKILISGGGRCNFTNLQCAPDRFFSENPHFCKSALARYGPQDFIALVEKHGIAYHEKTLGQLFCDGSAKQIVQMLLDECAAAGVAFGFSHVISGITKPDRFHIATNHGEISAPLVVLASGGLSIPKLGATGLAYQVAKRFALPVIETRPGLVPLTFSDDDLALMRPLAGVAVDVMVRSGTSVFRENMLFTHRGLSGPAILQVSSVWAGGHEIEVDLLPGTDASAFLLDRKKARPRVEAKTALAEVLPKRLAAVLTDRHLPPGPMGETSGHDLTRLGEILNHWRLLPTGSEGFAKAEVTVGGVDTTALASKTMEANAVPGLYVIGEAVDVTGWLGGYNFQWAWASGWVAGTALPV